MVNDMLTTDNKTFIIITVNKQERRERGKGEIEMKVRQFLQKFMVGCSTIDAVHIRVGLDKPYVLSRTDVQKEEYYGFGIDKVVSFEIHDTILVLNIQITR